MLKWIFDKGVYDSGFTVNYLFVKDFQMILCTVLGKKMEYAGEVI